MARLIHRASFELATRGFSIIQCKCDYVRIIHYVPGTVIFHKMMPVGEVENDWIDDEEDDENDGESEECSVVFCQRQVFINFLLGYTSSLQFIPLSKKIEH